MFTQQITYCLLCGYIGAINNIIAFIFLQSKIILFHALFPRWLSEAAATFINIGFV